MAGIYFAGFTLATITPSALNFAAYNTAARAAFLRSAAIVMPLAQLQALTGTLIISVDGVVKTSATINLSGATSYSNAATLIAAGFTGGPTVVWSPTINAFIVASTTTGATSLIDYASGTLSTSLGLTAAAGAITSQGAVVDTPGSAMDNAVAASQRDVTFMTLWEPVTADKQAFGVWASAQQSRYLGAIWDTDQQANVSGSTTCFGYLCKANSYDGILPLACTTAAASAAGSTTAALARNFAAFACAIFAATNPNQLKGRKDFMFSQGSIAATAIDQTSWDNLKGNGYSFYGDFANGSEENIFAAGGALPGSKWRWADSFVNQVVMRNDFQNALTKLAINSLSIGYDEDGYNATRAALADPINTALNFGAIRAGVTLSTSQAQIVNQAAGVKCSDTIQTQGWYLQVLDPGATVRAARGTPIINFWYTDGQSIQSFTMASVSIQ